MIAAVVLFWGSLAALAWTHALYPLAVALAARVRTRRVALDDGYLPSVAVIVTAYNEESAIERRLANLRGLDYPPELVELVVTSDASTDRTEELAEAAGARVIRNPRGGKVAAQDAAVRAPDADVDPRFGHDLSLPYLMVQRGLRAVYEPEALASERPTPTNESEYRRKVRMFEHAWLIVLRGRMLRGQRPGYFIALVSHRHLRYASGLLHLILLGSSIALIGHGAVYAVFLGLQLGLLAAALAGVGIARYYVLITWATVVALRNYLRHGVPATWAPQREELA